MHAIFILLLLMTPAAADPLTAEEFDALTQGRTMYFSSRGAEFGGEEYHPNRRVRWSFLDGRCLDGYWYEDSGNICFVYEDDPVPVCWTVTLESDRLVVDLADSDTSLRLVETQETDEPLMCVGPDIGV